MIDGNARLKGRSHIVADVCDMAGAIRVRMFRFQQRTEKGGGRTRKALRLAEQPIRLGLRLSLIRSSLWISVNVVKVNRKRRNALVRTPYVVRMAFAALP